MTGKAFAITGARRGIGATALALGAEGCRLGLGGRDVALDGVARGVAGR